MLPPVSVFHLPWEVKPGHVTEGSSLRTFGRLVVYSAHDSRASLSSINASQHHSININTRFVEPFQAIMGAQYLVLGEVEAVEGECVLVQARVFNCVDGVNVSLLQKNIQEQRDFFHQRRRREEEEKME